MNNYKISKKGIDFIAKWEGKRNTSYICPAGYKTIGIGHVILPTEKFIEPISDKQIEEIFRKDIEKFERAVNNLVRVKITQNQFDALVSFTFNIGITAFANSTLLKKLNRGDFLGAADEFTRWVYAGSKILVGLQRRRHAEKNLFLTK